MELERLHQTIRECQGCALGASRTQAVPGKGPSRAAVMFVGEAPGQQEDKSGEPFVGAAGKLLDALLAGAGIKREEVFITSILKCRPPGNRNPQAGEISACAAHLNEQISIIQPRILCPLGNFALKALVGKEYSIGSARGQVIETKGRIVFPLLHPAAGLYNPKLKPVMAADMAALKGLIDAGT